MVQTTPPEEKRSPLAESVLASEAEVAPSGGGVVQANKPETKNPKQRYPNHHLQKKSSATFTGKNLRGLEPQAPEHELMRKSSCL